MHAPITRGPLTPDDIYSEADRISRVIHDPALAATFAAVYEDRVVTYDDLMDLQTAGILAFGALALGGDL